MDFVRTLQSLEEAVYEIVTWILFLPKTGFQVFFKPGWVHGYVSGEFEKKPEERFQSYLSPVLFWLIVAVVPYAATSLNTDTTQLNIRFQIPDSSVLILPALVLIAIPMWFTLVLSWLKKISIDRASLKRLFYMQCYPVALFEIALLPLALRVALRGGESAGLALIGQIGLTVGGLWFYLAEVLIFRHELDYAWWKALVIAGLATLMSLLIVIVVLTAYVAFLIATGAMQMPG